MAGLADLSMSHRVRLGARPRFAALRAHRADREQDFDAPAVAAPLIAPLVITGTEASIAKDDGGTDGNSEAPFRLTRSRDWCARQCGASPVIGCAKARCPTTRTQNYSLPRRTRSDTPSAPGPLPGTCPSTWFSHPRSRLVAYNVHLCARRTTTHAQCRDAILFGRPRLVAVSQLQRRSRALPP
ncbi:hypothetical protein AWB67_07273 [Caballeronia terrestris]|uniref:Uncharacterized protein n=1 Tax=Caballeronia terrestris TaxID=1226301 RepID=A0A158L1C9_9BURK|nr:hypothetical protein AWB67_07273 [Caballeronia terrestris]